MWDVGNGDVAFTIDLRFHRFCLTSLLPINGTSGSKLFTQHYYSSMSTESKSFLQFFGRTHRSKVEFLSKLTRRMKERACQRESWFGLSFYK